MRWRWDGTAEHGDVGDGGILELGAAELPAIHDRHHQVEQDRLAIYNVSTMPFAWDPEMLAALERLGVRPVTRTRPTLVKDYVSKLYRYELRRLRDRLLRGEFAKVDYKRLIVGLRPRYWMLSIPAARWADEKSGAGQSKPEA